MIWFNPTFSLNFKTYICKKCFKLIRKHFSRNHSFRKIFSLNTVKISYSSMINMTNLIKRKGFEEPRTYGSSNCRVKCTLIQI